jgi:hypothetical protein
VSISIEEIVLEPNNGMASITEDGNIQYTPNIGFSGTDSIYYLICDSQEPPLCDTGIVFIEVETDNSSGACGVNAGFIGLGTTNSTVIGFGTTNSTVVCAGGNISFVAQNYDIGTGDNYVGIGISPVNNAAYPASCYELYLGDSITYTNLDSSLPKNTDLYAYSFIGEGEPFNYNPFCFDFSAASEQFVLLSPISINNGNPIEPIQHDNSISTINMTIRGGLPAYDSSENFSLQSFGNSYDGSLSVGNFASLEFLVIDTLSWLVAITDETACDTTFVGHIYLNGETFDINMADNISLTDTAAIVSINGEEIIISSDILDIQLYTNINDWNASFTLNAFPNPADNQVVIAYSLSKNSDFHFSLYNAFGQVVKRIDLATQPIGNHHFTLDIADLPAGIYLYQLGNEMEQVTKKLMVQ